MFIRDTNIVAKFFRPSKRETGIDCINFLNLLRATKPAPRRNLKIAVKK